MTDSTVAGLVNVSMNAKMHSTKKTIPPAKIIVRGKLSFCIVHIMTGGIIAPPTLALVRESPNAHPKSFKKNITKV